MLRKAVCLRRLGGDRGGELQAGRFFANPKVTAAKIVASWGGQTAAVAGRHVLAIEDTTAVSFATAAECQSARRGQTWRELGPLSEGSAHGLLAPVMLAPAMLAVDAASRACLGLVGGAVWNRQGFVKTPEWKRPLAQRESRRWVETAERAEPVLAPAAMVTVVTDREGDMYPLWGRVPALGWHVLSRVRRPSIRPMAGAFAVARTRTLLLPARPGQARREARVGVRFGSVDSCVHRTKKTANCRERFA